MHYIYTISHPLTNEIVYVGCTSDFDSRVRTHINSRNNNTNISIYINSLRNNWLLPKIEILEEVDETFVFESELYWIRQLKCWGFNLLNCNKTKPPKKALYSSNKMSYTHTPKVRKSRAWSIDQFFVGNNFELGTTSKRTFTANFKNYCRIFGIKLFLKYSEDNLTATIVEEKYLKPKKDKGFIWPKGDDRKRIENTDRIIYEPLYEIGASIIHKPTSFENMKTQISYYLKHIKPKRMNYEKLENGYIKATRIY